MMRDIGVVIIDGSNEVAANIGRMLETLEGRVRVVGAATNFGRGLDLIIEQRPALVILEADGDDISVPVQKIKSILARLPKTAIFAIGSEASSEMILTSLRAGASEYLLKPVSETDMASALQKLIRSAAHAAPVDGSGKTYTVFSPKGGAGVTTLAINLAVNIAELTNKRTVLVDLDHTTADVATFLDLHAAGTIRDAVSRDLGADFLQGIVTKHESGVFVLPQPREVEAGIALSSRRLGKLFDTLKAAFDYIIVDTGPHISEATITSMQTADMILFVLVLSLPGIKNAQRHLDYFHRKNVAGDKIAPVINRYHKTGDITIAEAENVLNHRIFSCIPNDYATSIEFLNKGLPFSSFAPSSELNLAIKDLALRITEGGGREPFIPGAEENASRFGFFSRTFFRRLIGV